MNKNRLSFCKLSIEFVFIFLFLINGRQSFAYSNNLGSLGEEQASEKIELEKMRQELKELKATTSEATEAFKKIDASPLKKGLQEFHLFCQQANHEVMPGKTIECYTYNGLLPGPILRVKEGQLVRIIVHNQLATSTSFNMHGMALPESVNGFPNAESGLIKPKQTYVYQFVAKNIGTYWYHPQVIHADQKVKGMYGVFIVDPDGPPVKTMDQDIILVLSDIAVEKTQAAAGASSKLIAAIAGAGKSTSTIYLVNGKTSPAIPGIEVQPNTRVRMRIINAGQHSVPLHLTGHKFELVSINGNLVGEQTARDTITCGVSDRLDLEFNANNPGVWCLSSELIEQTTSGGQFPAGIICLMRYVD